MKKIILSLIAVMAGMSINAQVVKVYQNGELSATYTNSSTNTVKVVFEEAPVVHEYVEIGGVKWATMNLGAKTVAGSPSTCFGDYYAWGETEPRYTSMTMTDASNATFGGWKDGYSSGYETYPSYTENTLDSDHDAATQNWGSAWHTPTQDDFKALVSACGGSFTKEITTSDDIPTAKGIYFIDARDATYKVSGMLFIDINGTSVFFPAAGNCNNTNFVSGINSYWSSSISTINTNQAIRLYILSSYIGTASALERYRGCPVRPVTD